MRGRSRRAVQHHRGRPRANAGRPRTAALRSRPARRRATRRRRRSQRGAPGRSRWRRLRPGRIRACRASGGPSRGRVASVPRDGRAARPGRRLPPTPRRGPTRATQLAGTAASRSSVVTPSSSGASSPQWLWKPSFSPSVLRTLGDRGDPRNDRACKVDALGRIDPAEREPVGAENAQFVGERW